MQTEWKTYAKVVPGERVKRLAYAHDPAASHLSSMVWRDRKQAERDTEYPFLEVVGIVDENIMHASGYVTFRFSDGKTVTYPKNAKALVAARETITDIYAA